MNESELLSKTQQLLKFRLAFAFVSLTLVLAAKALFGGEFDSFYVTIIILGVLFYSAAALFLTILISGRRAKTVLVEDQLVSESQPDKQKLRLLNAVLLELDVIALTALVHFTNGIESDLYVLYLLPILLSSYVFKGLGIYGTSFFVSLSYIGLLFAENHQSLPLLSEGQSQNVVNGLTLAYVNNLWQRILLRGTLLASVAFIWGGFCNYMAKLAQSVTDKLRLQLRDNQHLVSEMKNKTKREEMINSLNTALRQTLILDRILEVMVEKLLIDLKATACAVICSVAEQHEPFSNHSLKICQSIKTESSEFMIDENSEEFFPQSFCKHLFDKMQVELSDTAGDAPTKQEIFLRTAIDPLLMQIRPQMEKYHVQSLITQPIIYGNQLQGIILVCAKEDEHGFSLENVELIKTVADQVAAAIENANLLSRLSDINSSLMEKNVHLDEANLELRQVQSQLIHQEKMASLGRLVAGIAHELNNPINFVHGNLPYLTSYCEDMKKLIAACDLLPEPGRSAMLALKARLKYDFLVTDLNNILADMGEGVGRIHQMIKNLRSFGRLDEAELKEASINEGIESTLKILGQYYGKDKIPLDLDLQELPQIICYPGQLNQVWMNLLSNAAEAADTGSEPRVQVKSMLEDGHVLVTVADNGPGINDECKSKIFEPFFTTKPVGKGTGLGLPISHSIVEKHQGKIWFENVPEGGTVFKVLIPLQVKPHLDEN